MGDPLSVPAAPRELDTSQPSSQLVPETRDSLASATDFLCQLIFAARDLANTNTADRLAQYREAVLWANASQGPERIALSHETALLLYGISDANPARVNLTVPTSARLRRKCSEWGAIHSANLSPRDIREHEGLPITTVSRSIMDVLSATRRIDDARQSVSDALREGLLDSAEARSHRRSITRTSFAPSPSTNGGQVKVHEAATG